MNFKFWQRSQNQLSLTFLLTLLFLSYIQIANAQQSAGTLDASFAGGGKIIERYYGEEFESGINSNFTTLQSLGIQSNGNIILAGVHSDDDDSLLGAYSLVGHIYSSSGQLLYDFSRTLSRNYGAASGLNAIHVKNDNSFIIAVDRCTQERWGLSCHVRLLSLNADGTCDPRSPNQCWVDAGGGYDSIQAMAFQPDGKLVVAGKNAVEREEEVMDYHSLIRRYNPDGTRDTSFNAAEIAEFGLYGGNCRAIGFSKTAPLKILLAGEAWPRRGETDYHLVRLMDNGSLDTTFGNHGAVQTDFFGTRDNDEAKALLTLPGGKVLVAGMVENGQDSFFGVVRYNWDGSLDETFGSGTGKVFTSSTRDGEIEAKEVFGLATQNEKIILFGMANLAAYTNTTNECRAPQVTLARYNSDGTLDRTFGATGSGISRTPAPIIEARPEAGRATCTELHTASGLIALQPDGKILTAGGGQDHLFLYRFVGEPRRQISVFSKLMRNYIIARLVQPALPNLDITVFAGGDHPVNTQSIYFLVITNSGSGTIENTSLTHNLPGQGLTIDRVSFMAANGVETNCIVQPTVRCNIGTLGPGASVNVNVRATPRSAGTYRYSGQVTGNAATRSQIKKDLTINFVAR